MNAIQGKPGKQGVVLTTLRLPEDLRDEMKKQAADVGRSLNTHMVMILRKQTEAEVALQK